MTSGADRALSWVYHPRNAQSCALSSSMSTHSSRTSSRSEKSEIYSPAAHCYLLSAGDQVYTEASDPSCHDHQSVVKS